MEEFKLKYGGDKNISAIYYYISKVLKDLKLEYMKYIEDINKYVYFDMYSPELNLAIEYDRYIRSNEKFEEILRKEQYLIKYVNLIKIRENKLQLITLNNNIYKFKEIHINCANRNSINFVIKEILIELSKNYNINNIERDINLDMDIEGIKNIYNELEHRKSLASKYPEIYSELYQCMDDNIKIEYLKPMSNVKVKWKCSNCGNIWSSTVAYRTIKNKHCCPYCSNRKVKYGYNDLGTTDPNIAKEWNYIRNGDLTPRDVTSGSGKKVWWTCSSGHEWESIIKNRTKGNGCPYCSNKKVLQGYNDLATTHPDLVKEWSILDNGELTPTDVVAGSFKKVTWVCSKGHKWINSIYGRANSNRGCPTCSRQ